MQQSKVAFNLDGKAMIIGITGLAASGKQIAADYLHDKYGYSQLDFSKDALLAEAEKRGIQPTKMNLSLLGDELRAEGGNAVLAKILLKKISGDNTAITGFRSPEEADCIRNEFPDTFYLIEVFSAPAIRFKRRKPDDPQTEKEFFARDERDIKNKGLNKVLGIADLKLENNSTKEELCARVDELMQKIEKGELDE